MTIRIVVTDLDGTMLEPDGTIVPEVHEAIAGLAAAGVPLCPVTSKTAAELAPIMRRLRVASWAGFENGAGVLRAGRETQLLAAAVPLAELLRVFAAMRRETGAPVRSLSEIGDDELTLLTGLKRSELAAARTRQATLPLVVEHDWDERLRAALQGQPCLRLVRGNRFLHLQGSHSKGDVVPRLVALAPPRPGLVVACGDAPNDAELLAAADVAVIVPGHTGPNQELVCRFPTATVARYPHGRGWAAAISELGARP